MSTAVYAPDPLVDRLTASFDALRDEPRHHALASGLAIIRAIGEALVTAERREGFAGHVGNGERRRRLSRLLVVTSTYLLEILP